MRPLKLRMHNFISYAGDHEVDFESFGSNGLFLITGPTGSGKTTIFDGIMYALYGKCCSANRSSTSVCSTMAGEKDKCFVELEFETGGQLYTIKRFGTKEGEKSTKVPKPVLIYPDGHSEDGKVNLDKRIKELIGLDADQFKQVALLAQGDFQQILNGDTTSRKAILRSLLATQRFFALQNKIIEKDKHMREEISHLRTLQKERWNGVLDYPDEVQDLALLQKLIEEWKTKIEQAQAQAACLDKDKAALLKEMGILSTRQNSWLTWNQAKMELQIWKPKQQQANDHLAALEAKKPEMDHLQQEIVLIEKQLEIGLEKQKVQKQIKQLESQLSQLEQHQHQLEGHVKDLEDRQEQCEANLKTLEGIEQAWQNFQQLEARYHQFEQAASEHHRLQMIAANSLDVYTKSAAKAAKAQSDYRTMQTIFLAGQAGVLAQSLMPGQPCPVCGALDHPHPAPLEAHTPSEAALKRAQTQAEKAEAEEKQAFDVSSKANSEVKAAQSRLDTLQKELPAGISREGLNRQRHQFEQDLKAKKNLEALRLDLRKHMQSQKELLDKASHENSACAQSLAQARGKETQMIFEYPSLKEAKDKLQMLEQQKADYEKNLKQARNTCTQAESKVSSLQGTLKTFEGQQMEDLSAQLEGKKQEQKELDARIKDCEQVRSRLRSSLDINTRLARQIEGGEKELSRLEAESSEVLMLRKALCGDENVEGQGKIDLETYVQAAFFENVLNKANIRLDQMSNGHYELRRSGKAAGRSRVGLDLEVFDKWGLSSRKASSLSGGETFEASLALALGLSDAIMQTSGGTALDTLFVDEGFGSLDASIRQKAIATLEELASRRLVGIISHVPDIQDAVDAQIVVSQDQAGKSSAKLLH